MTTWVARVFGDRPEEVALHDGRLLIRWDRDPLIAAVGCRAYVSADGLVVILGMQNTGGQDYFCTLIRRDYGALTEKDVSAVSAALYGLGTLPHIERTMAGAMVTRVFLTAPKASQGPT